MIIVSLAELISSDNQFLEPKLRWNTRFSKSTLPSSTQFILGYYLAELFTHIHIFYNNYNKADQMYLSKTKKWESAFFEC